MSASWDCKLRRRRQPAENAEGIFFKIMGKTGYMKEYSIKAGISAKADMEASKAESSSVIVQGLLRWRQAYMRLCANIGTIQERHSCAQPCTDERNAPDAE